MITIVLSERDFDYELQALVNSFFPWQKSTVCVETEEEIDTDAGLLRAIEKQNGEAAGKKSDAKAEEKAEDGQFAIGIVFKKKEISILVLCGSICLSKSVTVSGEDDWHRHKDKSAHPYRTYYKNELKRLLFHMLCEIPEKDLPAGIVRKIPDWGTMTGVRPTKIPMNELLQGKTGRQVEESLKQWYCCTDEKRHLCLSVAQKEAELLKDIDFDNGYSLYIGIPFCPTTCLYCSFPSYPFEQFGHLAGQYLQALKKEIVSVAKECRGHKLTSIYIGGGTPTALTAEQLDELLACVRTCFPVDDGYEFTVEAGRPDSITREKLEVLRRHGVERISVNPQTMQQKTLDLIGRKHTVTETKEAFQMAKELGFTNINMDLIAGLPGETLEDFSDTLQQIRQLNPDSLTVHSLVVKRASRLRSVLEQAGDYVQEEKIRCERMEQMLIMAQEFAKQEGYQPYYMYRQKNSAGHFGSSGQENIGFSREGKECLYNILIMEEMQTIVAVGAGASTKRYHPDKKIVSRVENVKSITDYISRIDEMIERKKGIFVAER
ncbi:MAG: coproporphyrinogen dehydrogenase HemZ [Butyribacter sp.]|nr:coproporphyrinogen dehydrogenase HemZ [bacterium]MDY3853677.1 coproporphyrinogen dehydrogenase HemZ [Butyribacter sp.]